MQKETKLYVGNIPDSATNEDIYELFEQYGKLSYVDFKQGKSARYAFAGFRDCRDADKAVENLHDKDYRGRRLKVELQNGVGPRGRGGKPLSDINDDHTRVARGPGGPQRRTDYRVFIDGIPQTGSWQDIKDCFRAAGEVCYTLVNHNRTGIVEFEEKSSVQKSIEMFDKTEFVSHLDEAAIIRVSDYSSVKTENDFCSCSRSSYLCSSPSRTRSPSRSQSRSRLQSRSPSHSQSPSHSPSSSHSQSSFHTPPFRSRTPSPSSNPSVSPKRRSPYESRRNPYSKKRRHSRHSTLSA